MSTTYDLVTRNTSQGINTKKCHCLQQKNKLCKLPDQSKQKCEDADEK